MKLIGILIALLILGLVVYKQIEPDTRAHHELPKDVQHLDVPKVPTKPDQVEQFGQDMNAYMQDEGAKRAAALEDAEPR